MAENATVARPYAQAIFELARDAGVYGQWSETLALLVAVTRDPTMLALIHSPRVKSEELATLIIDVCAERLDDLGRNVVRLLAGNDRLELLPAIAEQYDHLRAEAEGIVDAELITARPASEEQRARVAAALERRFGSSVNLRCTTDESLISGAVIRAGDWVIDGSARARLAKLAGALGA